MNRIIRSAVFAWLVLASPSAVSDYTLAQPMTVAPLNGINIAYTVAGDPANPAVLLIMGLTASHRLWGEDLVDRLTSAGFYVVLFDNRDTGGSERLVELGEPVIWWEVLKDAVGFDMDVPYTLSDMAADGIAVLDTLGIERAHIVGASMGGMIAQVIAVHYPERTRSLVSIMSTTGAPHLPEASDDALAGLEELGGSDAGARLHEIGLYPEAMPRQLMAIIAAGDRSAEIATITAPTLVLHGADDTLLKPPHGEHTAELIAGSKFVIYPDMGHNLPPEVLPGLATDMVAHMVRY